MGWLIVLAKNFQSKHIEFNLQDERKLQKSRKNL